MASRSEQACKACKKQKRRCDKARPECSLCKRTQRLCEYGITADFQPTASDWHAMQARLTELENRLAHSPGATEQPVFLSPASVADLASGSTFYESVDTLSAGLNSVTPDYSTVEGSGPSSGANFPASMFLDIDCYVWSRARLPVPTGAIPAPVLELLSQGNVVLEVSQEYFATVHTWFPMVSKKRMDMGLPIQNAGPDLAMLFLGMKLITTQAKNNIDSALYDTAKSFLASLESNGIVSLLCLQAMVLVALYEYSHAIYPAAWMTVGSCTRYSDILGLTPGDHSILGQPTTWTEAEERRRVWWSIYALDKFVSMGSRKRCMLSDYQPDSKLPVDDDAWDRGDVSMALGHSTSVEYQVPQSPFARLCQVSMYLGRAIDFARDNSAMSSTRIEHVTSFVDELLGFGSLLEDESTDLRSFTLLAPRCGIRSALFVALDRFTCPEKISAEPGYTGIQGNKTQKELELQRRSMQIMEQASELSRDLSSYILSIDRTELGRVSPFILDSVYAGGATFHWLFGESGNDIHREAARQIETVLEGMSYIWRLGSTYREMLKVHDISARVEARSMLQ
ncbi:fungal specific transcription factor factor [Fusarium beomiforme]|uniref:Fungal specific transcription factor factor n=1 Tax=Fusarium beomiforme TaxID=44412 RepID=A0A9P5ATQ6_9HYPO|nr:fungal specific transcription factor factor [Fusarium beomiforme]